MYTRHSFLCFLFYLGILWSVTTVSATTDTNECNNSTSHNCSMNADCKNINGNYTCVCKSGYEGNGTICNDINECNNSTLYNCSMNAVCKNINGSYDCVCKPGYDGNGTTCKDINECNNSTLYNCSMNAVCKNINGSYNCICKSGYEGNGTTCNDINECNNSTLYNCSMNAVCKNMNGSYDCICKSGYEGNGTTCNDINECKNFTLHNCSVNADCKNTNGSYDCMCKSGYNGNGTTCNDINECNNSTSHNCSMNADCKNMNGNYTCVCKSGYEGNGTTCNDINECNNSTLHTCSANANCTNIAGGHFCTCKSGFEGNGTVCNDIDECKNSTWNNCSSHAICKNTNGSFNCMCKPGYDGNGKICKDVNECNNSTLNNCSMNASCTNTNGSYSCACLKGYEGNGVTCQDKDECSNSTLNNCSTNATCKNTNGSFTCTCKLGYNGNGTVCNDIDECKNSTLHNCSLDAICKNTNGSFECTCKPGYHGNGKVCEDVDECKNATLNDCSPDATCKNTNGSFVCTCKPGFDGNGTVCNDNNECLSPDQNNCSTLAICKNKPGTYMCTCKDGYQGNGTFCEDLDECKKNVSKCDKNADCKNLNGSYECSCKTRYRGDGKQCTELVLFPYTSAINTSKHDKMYGPYDMYSDIHAFNLFFSTVYVSSNGYISLGSDPQISAQPLANYSFPPQVAIFAPFWAALDLSAGGKIYVDNYKICKANDLQMLNEIGGSIPNFSARRALVITWENASPYPVSEFGNETITFQMVLTSNEKKLYAIFNYDAEKIKFNENANNRPVLIGYFPGKGNFESLPPGKNIFDWMKTPSAGSTGRRVIRDVGTSMESSMLCLDWFCENENRTPLASAAAVPCPCTKQQAELDYTFQLNDAGCFETAFLKNGFMQTCCYDDIHGALLLDFPDGGIIYNNSEDISIGRQHCCVDYKLCNLFYEIYPSINCSKYKIPTEVLIWDPLIFNFAIGGQSQIFYGSGEYDLIHTNRLKLQARLELQKNTVTPEIIHEIPVYTAFAIKFDQDKFEFKKNATSITVTPSSSSSNVKLERFSDSEILVRTPMLQMKLMIIGDKLGVALSVPASQSLTNFGLMSSNSRNGGKLDTTTAENIYDIFADWKLSNQTESLFTYASPQSFSNINSGKVELKQFKGISANLTKLLRDNINKSAARCGVKKEYCELEFLLMNKTTILNIEKQQMENETILENFPPEFEGVPPAILVYKNVSMEIKAKDRENGTVTIKLNTTLNTNTFQFENNTFNWTASGLTKRISLKFFASDNLNAVSLYWPNVFICKCRNRHECQESSIYNQRRLRYPGANSTARMYILPCDCDDGYTGSTCEKKVQPCSTTSCYPNVACNVSNPANPCGPCPPGMEGNGVNCYDVNQCSKGVCSQLCTDLLGDAYYCSCRSGYKLAADNKTCIDIDECKGVNNCTKEGEYCANNDGSYDCKCNLGYISQNEMCLSLKGKSKIDGSLVFLTIPNVQVWSEDLKNNSSPDFKKLATTFKQSLLQVLPKDRVDVLEVTSFEKVGPQQRRKKRDTSPDSIKGNYEAIGSNLDANEVEKSLNTRCTTTNCNIGNLQGVSKNSISVQAAAICPTSPCDPVSTDCVEKNGYECICKPGFENWAQYGSDRCKDIDECSLATKPCGDVTCSNTIGSYVCVCGFGFVYNNKTKKCDDVCSGSVCNEGTCIRNAQNYRCSCKVGWIGETCDEKDPENAKMRINLIIVASVLGAACFLLICAIICMCRNSKSGKAAELPHYSETTWTGLPRARLRDVELNENGSRMDLTKNANQYDSLPGMFNPAYVNDGVERC